MLEIEIKKQLESKKILLMTHLVLGYPSLDENHKTIAEMAEAGVEIIELQIPFSEPIADGPVILKANSEAIQNKTKVADCMKFAQDIASEFPNIQFLFMTYYNIPFIYGEDRFIKDAEQAGIKGYIVPDLPLEESKEWQQKCRNHGQDNIYIFTPTNKPERLKEIGSQGSGFIYCVGRRGVTGKKTEFDSELADQIQQYRDATSLPIALGFGVQSKEDIDFLCGKVDIAVIGSKLLQVHAESGSSGVGQFLKSIRS